MDAKSLQSALLSAKLKKTSITNDSSKPQLTGFIDATEARQYQSSCLDINIEEWIDLIGEHSFRTVFCPLTVEDSKVFLASYKEYESWKQSLDTNKPPECVFSESVLATADQIASKLQVVMDQITDTPGEPVFIKLSSRSAKDAPVSNSRFRERFEHYLSTMPDASENSKLRSLLMAGLELMKMHTAKDAIDLFLKSERVYQDMLLAHDHLDRWAENIVVRKWVDIDIGMEFRGFVNKGQLTALSQYNHLCFFPSVHNAAELIPKRVVDFFQNDIQHRLAAKFESYVIDFALVQAEGGPAPEEAGFVESAQILVIELNPFLETTDGALFSWTKERSILENGPFEFRHRSAPAHGAKALIGNDWRDML